MWKWIAREVGKSSFVCRQRWEEGLCARRIKESYEIEEEGDGDKDGDEVEVDEGHSLDVAEPASEGLHSEGGASKEEATSTAAAAAITTSTTASSSNIIPVRAGTRALRPRAKRTSKTLWTPEMVRAPVFDWYCSRAIQQIKKFARCTIVASCLRLFSIMAFVAMIFFLLHNYYSAAAVSSLLWFAFCMFLLSHLATLITFFPLDFAFLFFDLIYSSKITTITFSRLVWRRAIVSMGRTIG
jgi:hypothetical protein